MFIIIIIITSRTMLPVRMREKWELTQEVTWHSTISLGSWEVLCRGHYVTSTWKWTGYVHYSRVNSSTSVRHRQMPENLRTSDERKWMSRSPDNIRMKPSNRLCLWKNGRMKVNDCKMPRHRCHIGGLQVLFESTRKLRKSLPHKHCKRFLPTATVNVIL